MALEPLTKFEYFSQLPIELRLRIWEFFFDGPRIHVVYAGLQTIDDNAAAPWRTVYLLNCTEVDAGSNVTVSGDRFPTINHEAQQSMAAARRALPRVSLALNLTDSSISSRNLAGLATDQAFSDWKNASPSVPVDWERDLLYLAVPNSEKPFEALEKASWIDRVCNLAILVPTRGLRAAVPFGTNVHVGSVLTPMTSLRQLFMIPVIKPERHRAVKSKLSRNEFGFVPYRDYVREVGAVREDMNAGIHQSFIRAVITFDNVLQELGRGFKAQKMVDVDCARLNEKVYQRHPRGTG